jgi:mono/diheme cytochrome c family protein
LLGTLLGSFCLGLICAASVSARSSQDQAQPPAPIPAPITDGPTLFHERGCAQCHAIRGVGGHKGPDLSGVGRRLKQSALELQIVHGGDAMPAFGDAIPPEEVRTLVKYLHRCRQKQPRLPKPMPAAAVPDESTN